MALRLSTGLRNALAGREASLVGMLGGDDIGVTDNGAGGYDYLTRIAADFVTKGFKVGHKAYVKGATNPLNDIAGVALIAVGAATLTLAGGTFAASQGAGVDMAVGIFKGGSLKDIFKDGVIRLYSGSQPATADDAETGTLLVTFTVSSGAFTAGAVTNGLELGTPASGVIAKDTDIWSGVAVASGTAGYFRWYDNSYVTGDSAVAVRMDGAVGTSGAQLNMSSTSITSGATVTLDSWQITVPAA